MTKTKAARPSGLVHGVLIVDKPEKMTSFDVVAQVRRQFGTRRVGHAGTLDPMATGVLVLLLGEATKLSNVLTTDKKSYCARVQLETTTDSLDRDGKVTRRVPLSEPLSVARLNQALEQERHRRDQIPPQVSAIKVDGKRSYDQARKGIEVDLAPRHVRVHHLELTGHSDNAFDLSMTVSKGYYVRSLGRDLAEALGTVGHLTALRRTKSGPFSIEETHPLPLSDTTPLLSIEEVTKRCLPVLHLNERGALHVAQGKRLDRTDIVRTEALLTDASSEHGLMAAFANDRLIALVEQVTEGEFKVRRGVGGTE